MKIIFYKRKRIICRIIIDNDDFNITKITYKLTADKVSYGQTVFQNEDPKELFIAVNEFAWNITKNQRNSNRSNWVSFTYR